MKKLFLWTGIGLMISLSSCVSKKKYVALEDKYENAQSELYKKNAENEEYRNKLGQIQSQVDNYYAKINSLKEDNERKFDMEGGMVISKQVRESMKQTLQNVDPQKLAEARSLKDSMDLAVSYNLQKTLGEEGVDISVDRTVVEITISDKLLFKSSSYRVNPDSYGLLERIAEVAKSEPAIEVLVEGHTDSRGFVEGSYIQDNWDLSTRRSAAVVRILEDKYNVDGKQLIVSGRSSFMPVADNETEEGMAKNRRTRIIILPNLDKFLAMLAQS